MAGGMEEEVEVKGQYDETGEKLVEQADEHVTAS